MKIKFNLVLFVTLIFYSNLNIFIHAQSKSASKKLSSNYNSPFQTDKLSNGLDVITIENNNVPLVTISIAVRNGSFTEPEEFAGLSHLYEHMFFKANAVLPSQEVYMNRLHQLGIVFNGYTSDEVVVYFFTLPSKNLVEGVEFMANAIRSPMFKEDELARERPVVLGEFDRNEAEPTFSLRYALDSAMWNPFVCRKQPLGQRPVINSATVEKMKQIQKKFYIPNNSALIISGDVKHKDVQSLAKKFLGDWQKGENPFPTYSPPVFPPLVSQLIQREAKVPDVLVRMLFRGHSVIKDGKDDYTAEIIGTILGQGTSKFYKKFIDSGLVTTGGFGFGSSMNVSSLGCYLTIPVDNVNKVIELIKKEIKEMSEKGYFTTEEIATAKQIISDGKYFEQDNPQSFNINTTARIWSKASLKYYDEFDKNSLTINEIDINNYIKKYLLNKPFVLGIGSDKEESLKINANDNLLKW
ncbi:MAG: insulinase family protein [Chlorobiota bacterium]|jgi:zinc protease|nr:MAG: insulinase family protein [Chlorobiota bacterium]